MPIFGVTPSRRKKKKPLDLSWNNFRKGLNILLRDTEIGGDELSEADNLILTGKGVPTKRWGTTLFYMSGATGSVRALKGFIKSDSTNELLAVTDHGLLTKRSNASYSEISGVSWASGSIINMDQLADKMYLVSDNRELARYNGSTLEGFPTIAVPTGVFATQLSGASGTNRYGYRISAISNVGETLASNSVEVLNQPQDLEDGTIEVSWSAVSTASGILAGYNIYGRLFSDERYLGGVGPASTVFLDNGSATPQDFTFPPTADSTGGPKGKFIIRFQDRLVISGLDGDPSKVFISGREPNHEKFDVSFGGNFIRIEPDSGDPVTGLAPFGDKIIVFKERSIWQVVLTTEQIGNFSVTVPTATLITASHGCIASGSIIPVENDVFFLTRRGVYALGFEPNILNVIRTNEISAKVRPFFDNVAIAQKKGAVAFYHKFKYGIAFPGKNQTIVYDRERLAWMGPWTRDSRVFTRYFDSNDDEHLLAGNDDDTNVVEYLETAKTDSGTSIDTSLRTKKEDYGEWAIFKNIGKVFTLMRSIEGTVNVSIRIQDEDGNLSSVKSFTVSSAVVNNSGWGADQWGNTQWGNSEGTGGATDVNETYKWAEVNRVARNIQIIITTTGNTTYELLSIRSRAMPIGLGFLPPSERV